MAVSSSSEMPLPPARHGGAERVHDASTGPPAFKDRELVGIERLPVYVVAPRVTVWLVGSLQGCSWATW